MPDYVAEPSWLDAIAKVLQTSGGAMRYTDIADAIVSTGLKTTLGATPAATVASVISTNIAQKGTASLFVRVRRGEYILRSLLNAPAGVGAGPAAPGPAVAVDPDEEDEETTAVQALGMFWRRDLVSWSAQPQLLGQQQKNAAVVDFCDQRGIYLLHDGRETIYAGRVTDRPLGKRLWEHTTDRLNGQWDRFSWFGISAVREDGTLVEQTDLKIGPEQVIIELEAVLIEALEPPLNRRRGDGLRAVEYIQAEDPVLRQKQLISVVNELQAKLLGKP